MVVYTTPCQVLQYGNTLLSNTQYGVDLYCCIPNKNPAYPENIHLWIMVMTRPHTISDKVN